MVLFVTILAGCASVSHDDTQLLRDETLWVVVRTQVELEKLEDRVKTLNDQAEPIATRLNAALNRPSDAPLFWPVKPGDVNVAFNSDSRCGEASTAPASGRQRLATNHLTNNALCPPGPVKLQLRMQTQRQ